MSMGMLVDNESPDGNAVELCKRCPLDKDLSVRQLSSWQRVVAKGADGPLGVPSAGNFGSAEPDFSSNMGHGRHALKNLDPGRRTLPRMNRNLFA